MGHQKRTLIEELKDKVKNYSTYRPNLTDALLATYLGATVAANSFIYTGQAGLELTGKALGIVSAKTIEANIEQDQTKELMMPGVHGKIRQLTFKTQDGKKVKALDYPVVTEGKFLPSMDKFDSKKDYTVRIFGSDKTGYYLVDTKEKN